MVANKLYKYLDAKGGMTIDPDAFRLKEEQIN